MCTHTYTCIQTLAQVEEGMQWLKTMIDKEKAEKDTAQNKHNSNRKQTTQTNNTTNNNFTQQTQ